MRFAYIAALLPLLVGCAAENGSGDDGSVDSASAAQVESAGGTSTSIERLSTGGFVLRSSLPRWMSECKSSACVDEDGDGLNDAWEAAALDQLRPAVEFDEDEPLMNKGGKFAAIGRVAPAPSRAGHIVVNIALLYSNDYGVSKAYCFHAGGHDGDSEHVSIELNLGTTNFDMNVIGVYTAAHAGTEVSQSKVYRDMGSLESTADGRWRVYSSQGKHATYVTKKVCEDADFPGIEDVCLDEDCGANHDARFIVIPSIANAGEEKHPMVNALDGLGFAGDHAWGDSKFCGGANVGDRSKCAGSVQSKLTADPFAE